jgi:superfamily II DNA helicase RecQ
MIKSRPQSLDDLTKISGVGEGKMKKYGKIFLELVRE